MVKIYLVTLLFCTLVMSSCAPAPDTKASGTDESLDWKEALAAQLSLYGHRNWLLVVDKAFPLQATSGITYLDSKEVLPEVLSRVLHEIDDSPHIAPTVYRDAEFAFIDESIAPGADELKQRIDALLGDRPVRTLPHEDIFQKMDEAAKLFQVLVIKTEAIVPYSSVFIELDCAYWDADREQQLRVK